VIDDATGGARQNRGSPHTVARGARGLMMGWSRALYMNSNDDQFRAMTFHMMNPVTAASHQQ
jgi:hypothetical protein